MKQNKQYKTIGILGGMGPEGTVDMYEKIFKFFQNSYNAKYDRDFPLPLIDCTQIYANKAAKIASNSYISNSLVSREES